MNIALWKSMGFQLSSQINGKKDRYLQKPFFKNIYVHNSTLRMSLDI